MLSPPIRDQLGVSQGGNSSPILFRMYLAELGEYLKAHAGLCISDTIVAHLVWAEDLVLMSDSEQGLQEQLQELFNGQHIEQVDNYKYLGNILTAVQSNKGDIFSQNHDYLSGQSRKTMFSIKNG